MQHVETLQKMGNFIICGVIVVAASIWLWAHVIHPPKTNSEKYVQCTRDAGEQYDAERKLIAERNPDISTHEQYYRQASNGYAQDLHNCKELYP